MSTPDVEEQISILQQTMMRGRNGIHDAYVYHIVPIKSIHHGLIWAYIHIHNTCVGLQTSPVHTLKNTLANTILSKHVDTLNGNLENRPSLSFDLQRQDAALVKEIEVECSVEVLMWKRLRPGRFIPNTASKQWCTHACSHWLRHDKIVDSVEKDRKMSPVVRSQTKKDGKKR